MIIVKVIAIWLLMAATAVGNGILRERVLVSWLGSGTALPVSGLLLAALIFVVTYGCLPIFGRQGKRGLLGIGLAWTLCTLLFEVGFGHYVAGRSWREICQVFNLAQGNLFSLVLLSTLFSPWLAALLRWRSPKK